MNNSYKPIRDCTVVHDRLPDSSGAVDTDVGCQPCVRRTAATRQQKIEGLIYVLVADEHMPDTVPTSIRVVQGVAAHEGVDPIDLDPPLHSVIDTDALDALFRPTDGDGSTHASVEFSYRDKRVCVDSTGDVTVSANAAAESTEADLEG